MNRKLKNADFKNKDRLINEALEEFSTHSFKEASLNNIIKKAGVSKGSFYFHFRSKKSLYLYLFEEIAKTKQKYVMQYLSDKSFMDEKKDFFELLRSSAAAGIKFALSYPQYNRLAMNFYREEGTPIYNEVKKRFFGDFENTIDAYIEEAMDKGLFRDDFKRDFIKRLVTYLLANFDSIFPYRERENLEDIMDVFDKYIDFIKFGLVNFNNCNMKEKKQVNPGERNFK